MPWMAAAIARACSWALDVLARAQIIESTRLQRIGPSGWQRAVRHDDDGGGGHGGNLDGGERIFAARSSKCGFCHKRQCTRFGMVFLLEC